MTIISAVKGSSSSNHFINHQQSWIKTVIKTIINQQSSKKSSFINHQKIFIYQSSSIIKHFTNHHRSTKHWWKRYQHPYGSQHLFQRWRVKVNRTGGPPAATGIMFIEWDAKSMRLVVYGGLFWFLVFFLWFRGWSPPNFLWLAMRGLNVETTHSPFGSIKVSLLRTEIARCVDFSRGTKLLHSTPHVSLWIQVPS